ncbi:MAG: hypothetical protein CL878_13465 [Dehalococcoidia bacterium]|nr:hypothetical protein [Dehalococcoidia bacterium]
MGQDLNMMALINSPEWGEARVEPSGALLLFALVQGLRPQLIVDSGTYRGLSATVFALACPEAHIHTFDPVDHGAREHWERWGVADRITFHQQPSVSPPDQLRDVHFAFFDAADHDELIDGKPCGVHTGDYALEEWGVWRERLIPGASVGWHDSLPHSSLYAGLEHIQQTNDLDLVKFFPTPNGLALGIFKPRAWRVRRILAHLEQVETGGRPRGCYFWDHPRDIEPMPGMARLFTGI